MRGPGERCDRRLSASAAALPRGAPPHDADEDDGLRTAAALLGRHHQARCCCCWWSARLAGGGYWQRHAISRMFASFRSAPAPKPARSRRSRPAAPKIADRIGAPPAAPNAATAPAAAVAQKVVLYDEDPNDPQGKRYVGSAIWRTETVSPGPGLAPELACAPTSRSPSATCA